MNESNLGLAFFMHDLRVRTDLLVRPGRSSVMLILLTRDFCYYESRNVVRKTILIPGRTGRSVRT